MSPSIIKALRSIYKIGGIYFESRFESAQHRMDLQKKCKARFYCYTKSPNTIHIFNYGIESESFNSIIDYLQKKSGCNFRIIDSTIIKEVFQC